MVTSSFFCVIARPVAWRSGGGRRVMPEGRGDGALLRAGGQRRRRAAVGSAAVSVAVSRCCQVSFDRCGWVHARTRGRDGMATTDPRLPRDFQFHLYHQEQHRQQWLRWCRKQQKLLAQEQVKQVGISFAFKSRKK